jgi:hypothetical protein
MPSTPNGPGKLSSDSSRCSLRSCWAWVGHLSWPRTCGRCRFPRPIGGSWSGGPGTKAGRPGRSSGPVREVERARVVLLTAEEVPGKQIAAMVGCPQLLQLTGAEWYTISSAGFATTGWRIRPAVPCRCTRFPAASNTGLLCQSSGCTECAELDRKCSQSLLIELAHFML